MKFQKQTLSNGVRLVSVAQKDTKAFTVLVLFKVGSRYETKNINGISHFLEHMMFKGTKKRPNTLTISKELDAYGAEYNAFTSKDYTGYYIKINSEHREKAIEIISDMLFNSKFDAKEVKRERNVIMEEIHMYKDNPMMHLEDMLEEELFADSPLGWSIAGYEPSMHKISREDIYNFHKKQYIPKNTIVVFSGNLENFDIEKSAEKYFAIRKEKSSATKFKSFHGKFIKSIKIDYKKTGQLQLALGFPGLAYGDKDMPALNLLTNILGGTMSSRLFINIRERKGLAYFVRAENNPYQDTGGVVIRAGLNKDNLSLAIKTIVKELTLIKEKGVTEIELKRAKENIKGHLVLALEDSSSYASWIGKQALLTNKTQSMEEKIKELESVSVIDIKRVAKKIFDIKKVSVALIGPIKDKKIIKNSL